MGEETAGEFKQRIGKINAEIMDSFKIPKSILKGQDKETWRVKEINEFYNQVKEDFNRFITPEEAFTLTEEEVFELFKQRKAENNPSINPRTTPI